MPPQPHDLVSPSVHPTVAVSSLSRIKVAIAKDINIITSPMAAAIKTFLALSIRDASPADVIHSHPPYIKIITAIRPKNPKTTLIILAMTIRGSSWPNPVTL
jgi:hypothetical protein